MSINLSRSDVDPGRVDPLALAAVGIGAARAAIGAGIWLAPGTTGRALGFDFNLRQARTLGRLAGSRDLALGAIAISAACDDRRLRAAALFNACVDIGDATAFALELRRGGGSRSGLFGVGTASMAVVAGLGLAAAAHVRLGRRDAEPEPEPS